MSKKKEPEKPTEVVSVRMTPTLHEKAKKRAELERRSISNLVMSVLADYVDGKLTRNY